MNKEITKTMNKKENLKLKQIKRWWSKNYYKITRVILLPVWLLVVIKEKYNKLANQREIWNEERTENILNYYVPRRANWDKEKNEFYFFDNGLGWNLKRAKRCLKMKDYRYWKIYEWEIKKYLINNFELEGFTKKLGCCTDGYTEIYFNLK